MGNITIAPINKTTAICPVRMAQWAVDKMVSRTSIHLQNMMYSNNLTPDQLESLYIVHWSELNTYSSIRNISELYGEDDDVSALKFASYNPEHFVNSAVKNILKLVRERNIEIVSTCDKNLKSATFDLRRTSLILYNLVSNSIIHSKSKDKLINIKCFMRDDNFVISVADNGRTIPPDKRKTLFLAYDNKPTLSSAGLKDIGLSLGGLGLAVCRKTARDMGGEVVYVTAKEQGNIFELIIPQSRQVEAFGDTILAEPDIDELKICLAGAMLDLIMKDK